MKSKESITQKSLTLFSYPESTATAAMIPPIKSDKKLASPSETIESQFHIYKKTVDKVPQSSNTSNPDNSIHCAIQSSWAAFTAMSDGQRNQMLKGILAKCSSKQVDYICTLLNLKMVGDANKMHVKSQLCKG